MTRGRYRATRDHLERHRVGVAHVQAATTTAPETVRSRLRSDRAERATGLREQLQAFPSIRAFYGTSLHSCLACDGYEKRDQPWALIGETDDLAERALLASRWSDDLIVSTNGVGEVSDADETRLAERGIRVERRVIEDVVGERDRVTGVRLVGGEVVERDGKGFIVVNDHGRTSVRGLYAAGDLTPPGPKQLIVAAGQGAMVAGGINRDEILGWPA